VKVVGTSYDPYSVMNYCYLSERGSVVAIGFSERDIKTINMLYPTQKEKDSVKPTSKIDALPEVSEQPAGQPSVGQPNVSPTQIPVMDSSSGTANCNQAQLKICLDYSGGDACYPKWGCAKP
ncbi:MAG: hypothetical protein RIR26_1267, partial [Pseudomonadota bacterium]